MGLIYRQLDIIGNLGQRQAKVLFDTGASRSFVQKEIAQQIGTIAPLSRPITFSVADGNVIRAEEGIFTEVVLDGNSLYSHFIVVPDLAEEIILGADFMQAWKISLYPEREEVTIDPDALRLILI